MNHLNFGILVLASLFTLSSSPGVGSFSLYQVEGTGITGSYRIEITAFDKARNTFTQTYTTSINGETSVEDKFLHEENVNTEEENAMIVELCETEEVRGELVVVTVPAGTFDTCKLSPEDGQVIYMAAVPFGFAKLLTPEGNLFQLEDYQFTD